jgi:hypothetical protein
MDPDLYKKVKEAIVKRYPKHSVYRSAMIVKKYKELGGRYKGPKPAKSTGLARWFREDWKSDRGMYHYTAKSSVYRPTKRITSKTPLTFSEITEQELERAKREKARTGRVSRFRLQARAQHPR